MSVGGTDLSIECRRFQDNILLRGVQVIDNALNEILEVVLLGIQIPGIGLHSVELEKRPMDGLTGGELLEPVWHAH